MIIIEYYFIEKISYVLIPPQWAAARKLIEKLEQ
jgi:hypothetical protein